MAEEMDVRHTAKDSVFTDLFSIPKYLLALYQAIHPEDKQTTIGDLKSVTCRRILAEHPYNDLGFRVGDKLIVLVEAQSTWSPNIVIRLLCYWVQTLNNYFTEHNVLLYSNHKVLCPKPELYVIFTGERVHEPDVLSFRELYFPVETSIDIDVTVHMLYDRENGDIIHQYITFCKVLTEQIKLHGKTRKAVEETLRICRDKKVLEEYLKERETEIMDIMTTLFDQDYVTRMYGIEQRREGKEEGKKEGREQGKKEGREQGKKETAVELLACHVDKEIIMKSTGLSLADIQKLEIGNIE